jgi:hypothetical protein
MYEKAESFDVFHEQVKALSVTLRSVSPVTPTPHGQVKRPVPAVDAATIEARKAKRVAHAAKMASEQHEAAVRRKERRIAAHELLVKQQSEKKARKLARTPKGPAETAPSPTSRRAIVETQEGSVRRALARITTEWPQSKAFTIVNQAGMAGVGNGVVRPLPPVEHLARMRNSVLSMFAARVGATVPKMWRPPMHDIGELKVTLTEAHEVPESALLKLDEAVMRYRDLKLLKDPEAWTVVTRGKAGVKGVRK